MSAYFTVIIGAPSTPRADWATATDDDGLELRFDTGGEASAHAKTLNDGFKESGEATRAAVRRIVPDDALCTAWRERAEERFASGYWERVPWCEEWWTYAGGNFNGPDRDHFAHAAKGDATKVAFYASEADGMADRLTVITPGRYLARFFGVGSGCPALNEQYIAELATMMCADADDTELCFAETADDFEYVYTHGPSSCMSYDAGDYESECHPVRIYAAGDLQLAYLKRGDDIIARVLCWPAKHTYGRIYGDHIRLGRKMAGQGYHKGSLEGARMLKIEQDGTYVAPYIDGYGRARDAGDYLVIDSQGEIMCCNTEGLATAPFRCPHCGEHADRSDAIFIAGETREYWCRTCAEDDAFYCEYCGHYFANDDSEAHTVNVTRPRYWRGDTYTVSMVVCDSCFEHGGYVHVANRNEYWSSDATFQCETCNEHFLSADEHCHHPDTCSTCGERIDSGEALDTPAGADADPRQVALPLTA